MQRIWLNCILKNEIANLPRMLQSTVGFVTGAVIYDTGSTDESIEYVKAHCKRYDIECHVVLGGFKDFSQARNAALISARAYKHKYDYLVLFDADMELKLLSPLPFLTAEAYSMVQKSGGMSYDNIRLIRSDSKALYHGVTHEYLGVDQVGSIPPEVAYFEDHASGSNRVNKISRDIKLLEDYLVEHPGDARTLFYLAQTYKDKGELHTAIEHYEARIAIGGWEEEVWYSMYQRAHCYRALGLEDKFVTGMLAAYNYRSIRAEPLFYLTKHYREKRDDQRTAWLFADAGSKIAYPGDKLFVEHWMYDYGFLEEKSILGFYNNKAKEIGQEACDKLSVMREAPEGPRNGARNNMFYYLEPLKKLAPSFNAWRLPDVNPDSRYVSTNPSLLSYKNVVLASVRTVSYRIRGDGSYDYNGFDAIRTTTFLSQVDLTGNRLTHTTELSRPTNLPPPIFTGVLDVEDMRLFEDNGEIWANGCILEQNEHAWREQFVMKLDPVTGAVTDARLVVPKGIPKQNEKNWMPIVHNEYQFKAEPTFMYRPGVVIDWYGNPIKAHDSGLALDQFSGGGQVIPHDAGWLSIMHEARPTPGNGKRYYLHRFVWYDNAFAVKRISRPFVLFDRQIEFAAGLLRAGDKLCISFGVRDCEAWIATVDVDEVRELLWHS